MYQLVITVLFVPWMTLGPYTSLDLCKSDLVAKKAYGQFEYEAGRREKFLGVTIHPKNVKLSCQAIKS